MTTSLLLLLLGGPLRAATYILLHGIPRNGAWQLALLHSLIPHTLAARFAGHGHWRAVDSEEALAALCACRCPGESRDGALHPGCNAMTASIPQVRSAGVFASLMVSSLMLRENVLALIISQVIDLRTPLDCFICPKT